MGDDPPGTNRRAKKSPAQASGMKARQYRGKAFARDGQRRRRVRQDKFWVRSETVQDLVGPEALQTMQRLVEHTEFVGIDAADPLDRAHVFLIQISIGASY